MASASVNYPQPVQVNGFQCRNCSDVDLARKRIDPSHPQSGPDNRDAAQDPTRTTSDPVKVEAARKAAEARGQQVTGYSPGGAAFSCADPGQLISLSA